MWSKCAAYGLNALHLAIAGLLSLLVLVALLALLGLSGAPGTTANPNID